VPILNYDRKQFQMKLFCTVIAACLMMMPQCFVRSAYAEGASVYFRTNSTSNLVQLYPNKSVNQVLNDPQYDGFQRISWNALLQLFFAIDRQRGVVTFSATTPKPLVIVPIQDGSTPISYDAVMLSSKLLQIVVVSQISDTTGTAIDLYSVDVLTQPYRAVLLNNWTFNGVEEAIFSPEGTKLYITSYSIERDTKDIFVQSINCPTNEKSECITAFNITDGSGNRVIINEQRGSLERWSQPRFSPTGGLIAFRCDGVCLMTIKGTQFRRIKDATAFELLWENDQNLLYSTRDAIYRLSLATEQSTVVYQSTDGQPTDLALMPQASSVQLLALRPPAMTQPTLLQPLEVREVCTSADAKARLWQLTNPNSVYLTYKIEFVASDTGTILRAQVGQLAPKEQQKAATTQFYVKKTPSAQEIRLTVNDIVQPVIHAESITCVSNGR